MDGRLDSRCEPHALNSPPAKRSMAALVSGRLKGDEADAMMRPREGAEMTDSSSSRGDWLADYAARSVEFAQESAETTARIAKQWGERSLDRNDEWTTDSVTADLLEAWEYWTPLLGQGIDLGLEAAQRMMRPDQWDL